MDTNLVISDLKRSDNLRGKIISFQTKHTQTQSLYVVLYLWKLLKDIPSLNPEKWPMYWHSFGSTILFTVHYPLFYQDEWRSGMKALKVDSLSKLKKGLPELEKEVLLCFWRSYWCFPVHYSVFLYIIQVDELLSSHFYTLSR